LPVPYLQPALSVLSFTFASAAVCHCMFSGASAPQHARGTLWSITNPRHEPVVFPVAGQGFCASKLRLAALLRFIRPRESRVVALVDLRLCVDRLFADPE
jgi:hypothetical protein